MTLDDSRSSSSKRGLKAFELSLEEKKNEIFVQIFGTNFVHMLRSPRFWTAGTEEFVLLEAWESARISLKRGVKIIIH